METQLVLAEATRIQLETRLRKEITGDGSKEKINKAFKDVNRTFKRADKASKEVNKARETLVG
jgi:hypothetical protein